MISIISVIGKNREIGKNNQLLWHIPGDLPHFKNLTSGHPIVMGMKTFESIGKALPGRTNIVLSPDPAFAPPGVVVAPSFEKALDIAQKSPGGEEIFICGGGSVYAQAIDRADRLYLTVVDAATPADTFFPDYSRFTKIISREAHEEGGFRFTYFILEP